MVEAQRSKLLRFSLWVDSPKYLLILCLIFQSHRLVSLWLKHFPLSPGMWEGPFPLTLISPSPIFLKKNVAIIMGVK